MVLQQYAKGVEASLKSFRALTESLLACQTGGNQGEGLKKGNSTSEASRATKERIQGVETTPVQERGAMLDEGGAPGIKDTLEETEATLVEETGGMLDEGGALEIESTPVDTETTPVKEVGLSREEEGAHEAEAPPVELEVTAATAGLEEVSEEEATQVVETLPSAEESPNFEE